MLIFFFYIHFDSAVRKFVFQNFRIIMYWDSISCLLKHLIKLYEFKSEIDPRLFYTRLHIHLFVLHVLSMLMGFWFLLLLISVISIHFWCLFLNLGSAETWKKMVQCVSFWSIIFSNAQFIDLFFVLNLWQDACIPRCFWFVSRCMCSQILFWMPWKG